MPTKNAPAKARFLLTANPTVEVNSLAYYESPASIILLLLKFGENMQSDCSASKNIAVSKALIDQGQTPYYSTNLGDTFLGDSRELLKLIPDNSVSLVVTSPPFALRRKKNYGNEDAENYVEWFRPFAEEVKRILKSDGSFVIEIGGAWMPGHPVRSIYHYELLIDLVRNVQFHLAQEFFWFNPAKMPGPAQWVTIERIRSTDAVNTIWWLSKNERPKADNKRVPKPYSDSMKRLLKNGYNKGTRPSGHVISDKWQKDLGGAIPKNLLEISNTASNDIYQSSCRKVGIPLHPARFPWDLPEFFIEFLTDNPTDIVLDIFAGSNVTGAVAEKLDRTWLGFEMRQDFLEGSKFRFGLPVDPALAGAGDKITQKKSHEK